MTHAARARAAAHEPTDVELVATIAGGDLSSLGMLFDRYHHDVRRLLSRLGVAPFDLDDVVQQTFLDVPRASLRFRPDASVRPWLLGLATMGARRRRRSLARMFARVQRWAREPEARRIATPAEQYEQSEATTRAWKALDALPAKKRDAFVLVVLEGLSGSEAAQILGIPVATVWTRIHHARVELRRTVGEEVP